MGATYELLDLKLKMLLEATFSPSSICHPFICKKAQNNDAVFVAAIVWFICPPVVVFTVLNVIFPSKCSLQIMVRKPIPKSAFRIFRTFF